tara:strand:- start:190 stop:321 length:132 start_codon:yes stop_codon:yes gene_type:complete
MVPETEAKRDPVILLDDPDVDSIVLTVIRYVGDIVAPAAQSTL